MVNSMTGFATRRGTAGGMSWVWDMRSVNGRGLDLRLRLPEGIDGLEQAVRVGVGAAVARGNVTLSLKLERDLAALAAMVNPAALTAALRALATVRSSAEAQGLPLAPATWAEVLALRGVWDGGGGLADSADLGRALLADLPALIVDFNVARAAEGGSLARVFAEQLDRIEALTDEASNLIAARAATQATTLRANLLQVLDAAEGVDAGRVAQELALIAVKSDVKEEIDRLRTHTAAARSLLAEKGPIGRKFDFLTQEFNREANTLCSKAQYPGLTALGLDLKVVIDQMREQVANVE